MPKAFPFSHIWSDYCCLWNPHFPHLVRNGGHLKNGRHFFCAAYCKGYPPRNCSLQEGPPNTLIANNLLQLPHVRLTNSNVGACVTP